MLNALDCQEMGAEWGCSEHTNKSQKGGGADFGQKRVDVKDKWGLRAITGMSIIVLRVKGRQAVG
jgi:hypothetical protein